MKIKLTYDNPNHEELLDLESKSKEEAENKCKEIMDSNKRLRDRCDKSNVFVSQSLICCEVVLD